jgi:hypothetical protein
MPIEMPSKSKERNMENVKVISIGSSQTPINFMDGLALLFIGLKLTDHLVDWTWVEVLAPLWGPFMVQWLMRLVVSTFFMHEDDEDAE